MQFFPYRGMEMMNDRVIHSEKLEDNQAADFVSKAIGETDGDETHTYGVHFEKVLAKGIGK